MLRLASLFLFTMAFLFWGCTSEKRMLQPVQQGNSISLSQIAQELSLSLTWNSAERKAYLQKDDYYAIVQLQNDIIWIRGEPHKMEFPAYLANKEVYVPISTYIQDLKALFAYQAKNVEESKEIQDLPEPLYKIEASIPKVSFINFSVLLDPGHGGKDTGAIAPNGLYEKNFNLDIANKVAQILKDKGAKVLMTRNNDSFPTLDQRVLIANQKKANCLVSIHLNNALNTKASGFEVWISTNSKAKHYSKSSMLARLIRSAFQKHSPLSDRGIRKGAFRVIHETHIPSVLVECCFLSNPKDLAWISTEEGK
ncbi:MAG: N-acetylmuramoyl-L-alanine amidase, partial [Candidatus Brocadiae bacterium]|nr:N-acetylmuramoyl-L-alanine amidase [Candidatus Brocadiia bacterium]